MLCGILDGLPSLEPCILHGGGKLWRNEHTPDLLTPLPIDMDAGVYVIAGHVRPYVFDIHRHFDWMVWIRLRIARSSLKQNAGSFKIASVNDPLHVGDVEPGAGFGSIAKIEFDRFYSLVNYFYSLIVSRILNH